MAHTLKIVQNAATVCDLMDQTKYKLVRWDRTAYREAPTVIDPFTIHVLGSSVDALHDNIIALQRAIQIAIKNGEIKQRDGDYTPIYLQWQPQGGSTLGQSEMLGGDDGGINDALNSALFSKHYLSVSFRIERRPYFEETSPVFFANPTTKSNNMAALACNSMRGDLPAPFYVSAVSGQIDATAMMVGIRIEQPGNTIANDIALLEADTGALTGYTRTLGANTANQVDANFSNGNGARVTPADTTEAMRVRWEITSNIGDNLKQVRLFARCRETAGAGSGYKIRARAGINYAGNLFFGPFADVQKSVGVTGGTTEIPLIDCGVLKLPPFEVGTLVPGANLVIEIWGQAASATGPTFDIDCAYLFPCYEGGYEAGFFQAAYPTAFGNNALNPVIDAGDRSPDAYMVSGSSQYFITATLINGLPLFGRPNLNQNLFVMVYKNADGSHQQGVNNSLTVSYIPRYTHMRGA